MYKHTHCPRVAIKTFTNISIIISFQQEITFK